MRRNEERNEERNERLSERLEDRLLEESNGRSIAPGSGCATARATSRLDRCVHESWMREYVRGRHANMNECVQMPGCVHT